MFTARYELDLYIYIYIYIYNSDRFWSLKKGQSGTGTGFSTVLWFCHISIIPPLLHTHLHATLTRRKNGRSLGTFKKAMFFGILRAWLEKYVKFLGFKRLN